MPANIQKKLWVRVGPASDPNHVGTTPVSFTIEDVPCRGWIRRCRAKITSGTGTQVAVKVWESASGSGNFDQILAYSLTSNPMDSEEDPGVYYSVPSGTNLKRGTLYGQVETNNAHNTDVVALQLDIEPAI